MYALRYPNIILLSSLTSEYITYYIQIHLNTTNASHAKLGIPYLEPLLVSKRDTPIIGIGGILRKEVLEVNRRSTSEAFFERNPSKITMCPPGLATRVQPPSKLRPYKSPSAVLSGGPNISIFTITFLQKHCLFSLL